VTKRDADVLRKRLLMYFDKYAPELKVYKQYDDDEESYVVGVVDGEEIIVELVTAE
jgi:hypothetical protein